MTKRFAPLAAAALLALSLCACTNNTVDTPNNSKPNNTGNVSTTPNGTVNGTGDMTDNTNRPAVDKGNNYTDNVTPGVDNSRNDYTDNYPNDVTTDPNNTPGDGLPDDLSGYGAENGRGIVGRTRRALDNAGRSFRDSMN